MRPGSQQSLTVEEKSERSCCSSRANKAYSMFSEFVAKADGSERIIKKCLSTCLSSTAKTSCSGKHEKMSHSIRAFSLKLVCENIEGGNRP